MAAKIEFSSPSPIGKGSAISQGCLVMSKEPDKYDDKEAQERFEAALRGGLKTPAKPLEKMKLGQPRNKKAASPKGSRPKPQAK